MTAVLTIFRRFPTTVRRFPKIFYNCSEGQTNVSEHFPTISEDCRRLLRKTRRYFDHAPTNLSTIYETNLKSVNSSISLLVRMWKVRHSSLGCSFVWIFWVVYFPVKSSCLYIEEKIYWSHRLRFSSFMFDGSSRLPTTAERYVICNVKCIKLCSEAGFGK